MVDDNTIKIFGREPAAFIAVIGSILTVLAGTGIEFLDPGAAAAITALVAAIVMAYATRPVAPSLLTGVFTALVAVFTEYGLELSEDLVSGITAAILAVFAFITRQQVSPALTPITRVNDTGGLSVTPRRGLTA